MRMKSLSGFLALFLAPPFLFGQTPARSFASLYKPRPELKKKVAALLARMTLEEKVLQLASLYPNGVSRLGIPHMQACECLHGVARSECTVFPQAIALGCTWDPDLMERIGKVVAREARAVGCHQCYSPMLGLARDPRWGRADESYGEDPILVARMGAAYIRGLQGWGKDRFGKDHILCMAKHYVADGEPPGGDNGAAMEISSRALHELHLRPFMAAVREAGVGGIMPAHHAVNGIPCHINRWLLVEVLRKEFGFGGMMVSDNNDILRAYTVLRACNSKEECIRRALECGVTTELAWLAPWGERRVYGPPLLRAVKAGRIPLSLVDKAAAKVLEYKFRLGLFEDETALHPSQDLQNLVRAKGSAAYADTKRSVSKPRKDWKKVLYDPASDALALEAAEKAIVLLQNRGGILPLDRERIRSLAVIGPNADKQVFGGYSNRHPRYFVSILEGIRKHAKPGTRILYEKGCDIHDPSTAGIPAALEAARQADVTVLVVGGDEITMKENQDRDDLDLAGPQDALVRAVVGTGKPVVLVLVHGRALTVTWEKAHVPAILDAWYLGQETGNAVAKTLFGDNNPGGKLTVTYPRKVGQVPVCYDLWRTARPRNLYKSNSKPLWPFGWGLSYTRFRFSDFKLSAERMKAGERVYASVRVTNEGDRKGDEVVQFYVRDEYASLSRPALELKDFQRITLAPGESRTVRFPVGAKALRFWKEGRWIVEPGEFTLMVGNSSVHLLKRKLVVE